MTDKTETLYNWTDTGLWQYLEASSEKDSDRVRTTLKAEMPQIQTLLTQGGTSPIDFTLHDSQHSFRVAQRMVQIVPDHTLKALSPYELALLMLSAYLHDVGMLPPQTMLNQLANCVIFGATGPEADKLFSEFSSWTDGLDSEVSSLLSKRPLKSFEDLSAANLLMSHYCRYRHIDLGEQWIDKNLGKNPLGSYAQWISDLKLLCRSHGEGYEFISQPQFDPKPVGTPGHIVHLRYLSCVLRIADVVEFDPERTPEVIFLHRQISPSSVIFWYKDHFPTLTIDNGQMNISANPPDAKYHHAIELMCDQIEAELRIVSRINDEHPFDYSKFQATPTCHTWSISPNLRRFISPRNGEYEYIDGAFRPDTHKMLQLLSGKRLYRDEKVALREMLQNSFDAVRERIALERLTKLNPEDNSWDFRLSRIYQVHLEINTLGERTWISCTDEGVGMSKAIITQYLLVSGISRRRELKYLERRCLESGFRLNRTGQFGIGVLSYFMLADFVQFITRRNALCADAESNGWTFETEGIGSFGELRSTSSKHFGTKVSLRLRREILDSLTNKATEAPIDWLVSKSLPACSPVTSTILRYLLSCLCNVPCTVLISENGSVLHTMEPGWNSSPAVTSSELDFATNLAHEEELKNRDQLPAQLIKSAEESNVTIRENRRRYEQSLTWETFDGEFHDGDIAYRFWLPVFRLKEGASPAFALAESHDNTLELLPTNVNFYSRDYFSRPQGTVILSWKGMQVDADHSKQEHEVSLSRIAVHGIIQIDFRSETSGLLSVSRESIQLTSVGVSYIDAVLKKLYESYSLLQTKYSSSPFVHLWSLLRSGTYDASVDRRWPSSKAGNINAVSWVNFVPPGLNAGEFKNDVVDSIHSMRWQDEDVHWLIPINIDTSWKLFTREGWTSSSITFSSSCRDTWAVDRVVKIIGVKPFVLAGLHTMADSSSKRPRIHESYFPPEWAYLVGYSRIHSMPLYNRDCIISKVETEESRMWIESCNEFGDNFDPRPLRKEIMADISKCASWFRVFMGSSTSSDKRMNLWNALLEQDPEFVGEIFMALQVDKGSEFYFVDDPNFGWWGAKCFCVSGLAARIEGDHERIHELLKDPASPDWQLLVEIKQ